jgi:hypothetical protein
VIQGFSIVVPASELSRYLESRAQHHFQRAAECDSSRARLEREASSDLLDTHEPVRESSPSLFDDLQRRSADHRAQAEALRFASDHVVTGETYRLSQLDLRMLDMWPASPSDQPAALEQP